MASFRIVVKRSAAAEIEAIGQKKVRRQVVRRIRELSSEPRPTGCEKLSGRLDRYRIRQGDFRILYEVDARQSLITVVKVGHRREVYRNLSGG